MAPPGADDVLRCLGSACRREAGSAVFTQVDGAGDLLAVKSSFVGVTEGCALDSPAARAHNLVTVNVSLQLPLHGSSGVLSAQVVSFRIEIERVPCRSGAELETRFPHSRNIPYGGCIWCLLPGSRRLAQDLVKPV